LSVVPLATFLRVNLTVQSCCDKYCEKKLSAKIQRVNSTWRKTYWRRRVLAQGRLLLTKVRLSPSSFDFSKCWQMQSYSNESTLNHFQADFCTDKTSL
jgi:hypothetical protein